MQNIYIYMYLIRIMRKRAFRDFFSSRSTVRRVLTPIRSSIPAKVIDTWLRDRSCNPVPSRPNQGVGRSGGEDEWTSVSGEDEESRDRYRRASRTRPPTSSLPVPAYRYHRIPVILPSRPISRANSEILPSSLPSSLTRESRFHMCARVCVWVCVYVTWLDDPDDDGLSDSLSR